MLQLPSFFLYNDASVKTYASMIYKSLKAMQLSVYRCDQPGCNKVFSARAALYTHIGWHKRQGDSSTTEAGSAGPAKKRARVSADSATHAQRDLNSDLLEVLRQRELAESRMPMLSLIHI